MSAFYFITLYIVQNQLQFTLEGHQVLLWTAFYVWRFLEMVFLGGGMKRKVSHKHLSDPLTQLSQLLWATNYPQTSKKNPKTKRDANPEICDELSVNEFSLESFRPPLFNRIVFVPVYSNHLRCWDQKKGTTVAAASNTLAGREQISWNQIKASHRLHGCI